MREGVASSQSCSERQESSGESAAKRKKSPVQALWKTMKFWRRQPDFNSPSPQAEHSAKVLIAFLGFGADVSLWHARGRLSQARRVQRENGSHCAASL